MGQSNLSGMFYEITGVAHIYNNSMDMSLSTGKATAAIVIIN